MPGAPEDVNPLQDLDFGDEPLGPKSPTGAGARKAAPPAPQARLRLPPPARRLPRCLAARPPVRPKPPAPQPAPTGGGLGAVAQVPPALPRPSGDPFQEPPEPRPPRGIALDEKLEYFRSVLKLKEETLGRARAIYEQRDLEAARLREVAVALKGQLDEVLPQLGQLRYLPDRIAQLQAALEQERARADAAETQASTFEQQLGLQRCRPARPGPGAGRGGGGAAHGEGRARRGADGPGRGGRGADHGQGVAPRRGGEGPGAGGGEAGGARQPRRGQRPVPRDGQHGRPAGGRAAPGWWRRCGPSPPSATPRTPSGMCSGASCSR